MAKEADNDPNVFDTSRVRQLIELMNEHELNEIDLRHGEKRIKLRRGGDQPTVIGVPSMGAPMTHAPQAAPASPAPAAASTAAPAPAADDKAIFIKSPIIGTFYSRPKPTAGSFVKVGDTVTPDTIVCIVEAMKTFNEIPAGVSGKILEMLVKDEEAVDVNKPLFKVLPS
jgi:acetyl-CoA carboxylase biotin carboxyl carrier protein